MSNISLVIKTKEHTFGVWMQIWKYNKYTGVFAIDWTYKVDFHFLFSADSKMYFY